MFKHWPNSDLAVIQFPHIINKDNIFRPPETLIYCNSNVLNKRLSHYGCIFQMVASKHFINLHALEIFSERQMFLAFGQPICWEKPDWGTEALVESGWDRPIPKLLTVLAVKSSQQLVKMNEMSDMFSSAN